MPNFSKRSAENLATCHADLIRLFSEVVKHFDCKVTCGFRDKREQDEAYKNGNSQVKWPDSAHNKYPARAVDVLFYPFRQIDWDDREKFMFFRGKVYGIASQLCIRLKKTIPWDLPHYELSDDVRSGVNVQRSN